MFSHESQRLAAERIAEIKAQLKARKDNPKPVPVVVPADDVDAPF